MPDWNPGCDGDPDLDTPLRTASDEDQRSPFPRRRPLNGNGLSCWYAQRTWAAASASPRQPDAGIWRWPADREHPGRFLRPGRSPPERPVSQADWEADRVVSKVIGWAVIILIVIWIVSDPSSAGASVHGWIDDIISFFTHLARG
jgi:hypothetical protein